MATPKIRLCVGSGRFGIERHEAPRRDFPKQPSQPDGLGRMCKPHWTVYTRGLAAARKEAASRFAAKAKAPAEAAKKGSTGRATGRTRTKAQAKAPANAGEVAKAEAIVAEVDALPSAEAAARTGDRDVQDALETVAAASVGAEHD